MGLVWDRGERQALQTGLLSNLDVWESGLELWRTRLEAVVERMGDGPNAELRGAAWRAAQTLFRDRIYPIVTTGLQACAQTRDHVAVYAASEAPLVEDDYLNEDLLRSSVQGFEEVLYDMTHAWIVPEPWTWDDEPVTLLQQQITTIYDKIQQLQSFASQVEGLFDDEIGLAATIQEAVASISQGSMAADGSYHPAVGDGEAWTGALTVYTTTHPDTPPLSGTSLSSDLTLMAVPPGILDHDPLDPGQTSQGYVGDCWLVATVNALMETQAGRDYLKGNIKWDEDKHGYQVTIYQDGQPVTTLVTQIIKEGVQTNERPGVVSLYEAAVYQVVGWDELKGRAPWVGPQVLQDKDPDFHLGVILKASDDAVASGGSADGGISLVATLPRVGDFLPQVSDFLHKPRDYWPAHVTDASGQEIDIQVPSDHVMTVVDIRQDGLIGVRNPWGYWRQLNHPGDRVGGVVYMTPETFDDLFSAEVDTP